MEKDLYINLKKQIQYYLPDVKHVALWNNQFIRSNGTGSDGRKQMQFNYPCVFIQFHDPAFRQLSMGVQEFDLEVTLHLGFKTFETDDTTILDLKEQLYWVGERFQQGSFVRMTRVSETWDYDHDNISVLKMQFHTYGKDYNRYIFGNTQGQSNYITGETITQIVVPQLTGTTGNYPSSDNGDNEWTD